MAAPPAPRSPLSAVILTFQEDVNLGACLENVSGWAHQVFVVDSFSTDKTVEIAEHGGAAVFRHAFENIAQQRNWALTTLPFEHLWVLFLDANERLTPELKAELADILPILPEEVAGLYSRRRFIWMGRWLRRGGCTNGSCRQCCRTGPGWKWLAAGSTWGSRAKLCISDTISPMRIARGWAALDRQT